MYNCLESDVLRGLDCEEIIAEAKRKLKFEFPEKYSLLLDLLERFEPNSTINQIVSAAEKKFRLGLLTNMYPKMLDGIKERGLLPQANWEVVVDSCIVGEQKPDAGIYIFAEEAAGVAPQNILFIDNTQVNLDAAATRGWQTVLYDPSELGRSNERVRAALTV